MNPGYRLMIVRSSNGSIWPTTTMDRSGTVKEIPKSIYTEAFTVVYHEPTDEELAVMGLRRLETLP